MTCYAPQQHCECTRCVTVKVHNQKAAIRAYAAAGKEPIIEPFPAHEPVSFAGATCELCFKPAAVSVCMDGGTMTKLCHDHAAHWASVNGRTFAIAHEPVSFHKEVNDALSDLGRSATMDDAYQSGYINGHCAAVHSWFSWRAFFLGAFTMAGMTALVLWRLM